VNPLMNMMNPQQMLLGMLQQRNPQAFNQLQQLMQSGQNPQVLLSNMMGQLTLQQKQQFDSVANQYGLKR
jgi:hypothetical protein